MQEEDRSLSHNIPEPPSGLRTALDVLRRQLLDIGKRNRLVNAPLRKKRKNKLDIEDERSDEVFRILYLERKRMSFEPLRQSHPSESAEPCFFNVYDEEIARSGPSAHHTDLRLQTHLTSDGLQKQLLSLYRAARTLEEEQGISVLFLAMGYLRWNESATSDIERFAPLILLPVDLVREGARSRFKLVFRDQDLEPNNSLRMMLSSDFDVTLPGYPEREGWLPSEYFAQVRDAVSSRTRWSVADDAMELGFFSFAKFLMWRDLAPESLAGTAESGLLEHLLLGGVDAGGSVVSANENLDRRFPDPRDLCHVLDADSSQAQVIAAARDGRNLVVQGPPGTGKSQTIANIIASSIMDGKRVLFVAEKRAALDVVFARLEQCGLAPLCLELHSHKANRRAVYEDLKRTLQLGRPAAVANREYARVREVRDELNRMSALLHRVDEATGETPYSVIGTLSKLDAGNWQKPDLALPAAATWSKEAFAERLTATQTLAALTQEYGREAFHVWRGAARRLSHPERRRLAVRLGSAARALQALEQQVREASAAASVTCEPSSCAVDFLVHVLEHLGAMPGPVEGILGRDDLMRSLGDAHGLCDQIHAAQDLREGLGAEVVQVAFTLEWAAVRMALVAKGTSWFRWLSGSYRRAAAQLKSVLGESPPASARDRLQLVDRLMEYRAYCRDIAARRELGRMVFGTAWQEEATTLEPLWPALAWIAALRALLGSVEAVRRTERGSPSVTDASRLVASLQGGHDAWCAAWAGVEEAIQLDFAAAFDGTARESVPLAALGARLQAWIRHTDGLEDWHRLHSAARHAAELGVQEIRQRLASGDLASEVASRMLEFVRAMAIWERMCRDVPELQEMDGADRSSKVQEFRKLDVRLQALAAQEIALAHYGRLPEGSAGQVGILRGEANKKTRHMRLRRLLEVAGEAVATVKPVFLMSPMSVAQFLRPGGLTFDVLLIDEASQVRPADALGATMRARQIVVVGDQKQMPPTSFFDRQVEGDDFNGVEDIQAAQVGDMESILSLCESRAMPEGMLLWHYRSRHPSLIAVSNHVFYNNDLICPPSPGMPGKSLGFSFVWVDGIYDRGGRRDNAREAEVVCDHVLEHVRTFPAESLGVVGLSVAQRDAILNRIEYLRSQHPELDAYCQENREDAFFVKNLENVQGDERDVIFVSIGYGRDSGGYMSQSFGPISGDGGERRLNVLFTRSRKRCCVFSSIRHGDIRLDAKHAGPRVLRRYLKYAETGELDIPVVTGAEMDSPFEEAVAHALASHGYHVAAQVGSAGFRIDLAVFDPEDENRFILAVECDGARYHSSSWARERDRLRQTVLEQKGWVFHRIWSTDWFYNRGAEERKLLRAIDRARSAEPAVTARTMVPVDIGRTAEAKASEPAVEPYREALFDVPGFSDLAQAETSTVVDCVRRIVEIEGPVHVDIVTRRLTVLWGHTRTGSKIRQACKAAIQAARRTGLICHTPPRSCEFVSSAEVPDPVVRDRSGVTLAQLRQVEMLPPTEIDVALLSAVERNIAIGARDATREIARMLGFGRTPAGLFRTG